MSRAHHYHYITKRENETREGGDGTKHVVEIKTALCGEVSGWISEFKVSLTGGWKHGLTCPECNRLYYASKLKSHPAQLTSEKIELDNKARYDSGRRPNDLWEVDTRSLHRVMRRGKQIAWVYLKPGFGAGYWLTGHAFKGRRHGHGNDYDFESKTVADVVTGSHIVDKKFISREEALFWLADTMASDDPKRKAEVDDVKSVEDYVDFWVTFTRRTREREARLAAERQREHEETVARNAREAKERAEALDQLIDLATNAKLSNYQRAGLDWALRQLNIDPVNMKKETT